MFSQGADGGVVQRASNVEFDILWGALDSWLAARHDEGFNEKLWIGRVNECGSWLRRWRGCWWWDVNFFKFQAQHLIHMKTPWEREVEWEEKKRRLEELNVVCARRRDRMQRLLRLSMELKSSRLIPFLVRSSSSWYFYCLRTAHTLTRRGDSWIYWKVYWTPVYCMIEWYYRA